ncbi:MAG: hypothetical protein Q9207_006241 [Kuettlingeria erythrocarpa]
MEKASQQSSHPRRDWLRGLARGWKGPGDVVSLLMIINGDMVQKALAQLSGDTFVPVAFSFGWVVFSIQAFSTALGTGRLMPAPDMESIVINLKSGHQRVNRSWILGRLFRDWEYQPLDTRGHYITVLDAIDGEASQASPGSNLPYAGNGQRQPVEQLVVDPEGGGSSSKSASQPWSRRRHTLALANFWSRIQRVRLWAIAETKQRGRIWPFAWFVIAVQIVVASVPLPVDHDASALIITILGTILAMWCGSLGQWKEEKWCCRRDTEKCCALLEGNGGAHVMVLFGNGVGLDVEDLAGNRVLSRASMIVTGVQALLWVCLLILVARDEGQTWYLLSIGGLGILQNIVVAGSTRPASAFGFHLREREVMHCETVRDTLCKAEESIPDLGCILRPIFLPGKPTDKDDEAFEAAIAKREGRNQQAEEGATSSGRAGANEGNPAALNRRT